MLIRTSVLAVVAAAFAAGAVVAVPAVATETPRPAAVASEEGNPGMDRMRELMAEGNPGMDRMHELVGPADTSERK